MQKFFIVIKFAKEVSSKMSSSRILFISYEFAEPIFSGNGTYSRTLARGMAGWGVEIDVISAVPLLSGTPTTPFASPTSPTASLYPQLDPFVFPASSSTEADAAASEEGGRITVYPVAVSDKKWRRLDRGCDWETFAEGFASNLMSPPSTNSSSASWSFVRERLERLIQKSDQGDAYKCVMVVDWHGYAAIERALSALPLLPMGLLETQQKPKEWIINLNFRVYANTKLLAEGIDDPEGDYQFFLKHERAALVGCAKTLALCRGDAEMLKKEIEMPSSKTNISKNDVDIGVLLCPVRNLVIEAAKKVAAAPSVAAFLPKQLADVPMEKQFFLCCVRLSPEKNPMLFAKVVQRMASRGILEKHRLVPVVVGAVGSEEYADAVKKELLDATAAGAVVVDTFLAAEQLAAVFRRTAINFHPCLYDAFGLTVVESAVSHCPTILNGRDGTSSVGAADLLDPNSSCVVAMDMEALSTDEIASELDELLSADGRQRLKAVAENAAERAGSWTERACAAQLLRHIGSCLVPPHGE